MMQLALALLAGVSAETVLGSYIYQRHGDRLEKPTKYLTPIGTRQCEEAGQFFQNRYFSEFNIEGLDAVYNASQFTINTPSTDVLFKSMLAFTQGFYPKLDDDNIARVQGAQLSNDSVETTAGQLQYIFIGGVDELSDEFWKVDGSDCPTLEAASKSYLDSAAFKALNSSSLDFYQGLEQYVGSAMNKSKLNYGNAFAVFDHFLAQDVHNETFHNLIGGQNSDLFTQVRTLQDQYSRSLNANPDKKALEISGAAVLSQVSDFMSQLQSNEHPIRVEVLGGSYDKFYSIFQSLGWFNVNETLFTGIVNYASSLAFEVYQPDNSDSTLVRVGIRNGTSVSQPDVSLDFFPVFGNSDNSIPIDNFTNNLTKYSTASWCSECQSEASVCKLNTLQATVDGKHLSKLSPSAYGGIGAGVTLVTCLLAGGAIAALLMARYRRKGGIYGGDHETGDISQSEASTMASIKH